MARISLTFEVDLIDEPMLAKYADDFSKISPVYIICLIELRH